MDHNKIAEMRARAGMTQKQLADELGVAQQTVWYYENGKRDVKASVLVAMSKALGCTVSELLGLDPQRGIVNAVPSGSHSLPIVGRVAAGEAREAIEQRGRTHPVPDELWRGNEESVFVEISGNSMNRYFSDGTLVLVNTVMEVRNGDIAAVFVNGDEVTIKRVFFEDGGIRLHPESYDPEYRDRFISASDPDAPEVRFLGKAVGYTSPLNWRP